MDFLRHTPFLLDSGKMLLVNPETNMEIELNLMARAMYCRSTSVTFPDSNCFPYASDATDATFPEAENPVDAPALTQTTEYENIRSSLVSQRLGADSFPQPKNIWPANYFARNLENTDLLSFGDLVEGDEDIEKTEMWFPRISSDNWPFETPSTNVLKNLNIGQDLAVAQRDTLVSLLERLPEVFPSTTGQLGHCLLGVHHIDTGFNAPIKQRLRRFSRWAQDEIQKQVAQMLEMSVIRECESERASNCVAVTNKNRTARVCIDYRDLNAVTKKDCYPICDIQTLFDCLHGSALYTSLDLFSGYYQIEVATDDQEKTAFMVPVGGLYCFLRMPFGLCNAPSTFSRIVDCIFKDVKMKFVLPYLDDFTTYLTFLETTCVISKMSSTDSSRQV